VLKLPVVIAAALQTGFNRFLALDPDSVQRLDRLRGKLVCLDLRGLQVQVWLLFHADRVEVLEQYDAVADATISGAPFTMLAMAAGKTGIFDGGIEITGDVEVARHFSQVIDQLDIDWEEHLSALTGDMVARKAGVASTKFGEWMKRSGEAMQLNMADYLRDESQHLPHSWELEEFSDEVDSLRDRVALLEQRVRTQLNKS
jgi:ubiquinone biosynthesis protein UbiJ